MPGIELGGRRAATIFWLLPPLSLWCLTAWLARDPRPIATHWTDRFFVACWIATYASGWALAFVWRGCALRRMVFRALSTSVFILVLWLMVELPALLGLVDYGRAFRVLAGEWAGPSTSFISDMDFSFRRPPRQRWSGRPRSDMATAFNLSVRAARTHTFTTDSNGFRNPVDLDHADIALLGDSYVEGSYVSDEETCASVLQNLIGRPVANLAQSGFGTLQEKLVLERYAIPLQPRIVAWFFFEGNDLYNDEDFANAIASFREHGIGNSPRIRIDWEEFKEAAFTVTLYDWIRRVAQPVIPINVATSGWFRNEQGQRVQMFFYNDVSFRFSDYVRKRFEVTKAAFREADQLCRSHNIRLIVYFVPSKFRVYADYTEFVRESPCFDWRPWELPARFEEFCVEAAIEYRDLTGPMHAAAAEGMVLYAPEDSHWSQKGHEFVARLLESEWKLGQASHP